MRRRNHLVIFVKAARLGRVKTRLARDIGVAPAWAFAQATMAATVRRLSRDSRWRCWLAVAPDTAIPEFRSRFRGASVIGQGSGDLGARMGRVFRRLPRGPAVIVGTDAPEMSRDRVWRAFRALGPHDAVFGPAADGGYWLVGLKRLPRTADIFEGVRWSSRHALADTLANLDPAASFALLETLTDIDDGAAYARWRRARRS